MSNQRSRARQHILALGFALAAVLAGVGVLRAEPRVSTDIGIDVEPVSVFYDALDAYGDWISTDEYGWVWVPSVAVVGSDFIPYASAGQWVYTDAGWFFDSEFDWGWAPFHYGRWYFDTALGWVWVPGRVWAPAWVDWRVTTGFVGWSPRPPLRRHGLVHPGHWVFVREGDFNHRRVRNYVVDHREARRIYDQTTMVRGTRRIGDARIFRGPHIGTQGTPRGQARPIRVIPPRRGVVGRVRITNGSAVTQEIGPRARVQRPIARPLPRTVPDARGPSMRVQEPRQAIRGPVRTQVPRPSQSRANAPTQRRPAQARPQPGPSRARPQRAPSRMRERRPPVTRPR